MKLLRLSDLGFLRDSSCDGKGAAKMSTELTYKKDDVEAFGMYQLPEAGLDLYLVDSHSIYFLVCSCPGLLQ